AGAVHGRRRSRRRQGSLSARVQRRPPRGGDVAAARPHQGHGGLHVAPRRAAGLAGAPPAPPLGRPVTPPPAPPPPRGPPRGGPVLSLFGAGAPADWGASLPPALDPRRLRRRDRPAEVPRKSRRSGAGFLGRQYRSRRGLRVHGRRLEPVGAFALAARHWRG